MINRIVVALIERWSIARCLAVGLLLLLSVVIGTGKASAAYPDKPIRLMVGFPAGDTTDLLGRLIAKGMEDILRVPVVVTNKPGAGGALAHEEVRRSHPDGHTLGWVTGSLFTTTNIGNVDWDYKALDPVAKIAELPLVVAVRSNQPWKTWNDFLADAKKNPGKFKFGHAGTGSVGHLVNAAAIPSGVKVIMAPLGAAERFPALLGGQIDLLSAPAAGVVKFAKAGKMRSLLVSSSKRSAALPNTPTFKEAGIDLELNLMYGIFAPPRTATEIKTKLQATLKKVVAENKSLQKYVQAQDIQLTYLDGSALGKWLDEHNAAVVQIMKKEGLYLSQKKER